MLHIFIFLSFFLFHLVVQNYLIQIVLCLADYLFQILFTFGTNGGGTCFFSSFCQSILLIHLCFFNSFIPSFLPSLSPGSVTIKRFMKSTANGLQSGIYLWCICADYFYIFSFIYFRHFPWYGLCPFINSYPMIPMAKKSEVYVYYFLNRISGAI